MKKLLRMIFLIQLSVAAVYNSFSQEVRISDSLGVRSSSVAGGSKNLIKPDDQAEIKTGAF